MCWTCRPLCPSVINPVGTYMYYRDTGVFSHVGETGVHFMNYFNSCLLPELTKSAVEHGAKKLITDRILKVGVRMAENYIGIGHVKTAINTGKIVYHSINLVEYVDYPVDYYYAAHSSGHIVHYIEEIIK